MLNGIFAPEPVSLRGDLTSAYLHARWVQNLDPLYTEQIGFKLKDLADEFDIAVWDDELKPFYLEVHEYQENLRSEFEIALLGLGYATALRALRISDRRFGEREPDDIQQICKNYLETFLLLINKHLRPGLFTNSLARLIQEGASCTELYPCFWFAEDIAIGNIELNDIECGYLGARASTDSKEERAKLLFQAMNQIILENKERNEFLNIGPETMTFAPNDNKVRTKNYLPAIVNAAMALTKLVFGLR